MLLFSSRFAFCNGMGKTILKQFQVYYKVEQMSKCVDVGEGSVLCVEEGTWEYGMEKGKKELLQGWIGVGGFGRRISRMQMYVHIAVLPMCVFVSTQLYVLALCRQGLQVQTLQQHEQTGTLREMCDSGTGAGGVEVTLSIWYSKKRGKKIGTVHKRKEPT